MNQTVNLWSRVAENARTGYDAANQLLARTEDDEMRSELASERDYYRDAARDAEEKLRKLGEKADGKGPLARAGMWAGIRMNTMTDRTSSHLADIVIQGATMGVIDTTKARNEFPDADPDAQDAASRFITRQQDAIERMKEFLM